VTSAGPATQAPQARPARLSAIGGWVSAELLDVHVKKGRIRLSALSPVERYLAVAGMAMLGVLSVILLRPGLVPHHMLQLYSGTIPESIPTALPALLLVGLCFSWVLLICGSLKCPALVPAGTAVVFLLANAEVPEILRVLQPGFGTSLVLTGYLLAPAGLLAYSILLTGRYRKKGDAGRRPRIAAGTACLTGVALFYGSVLGIYVHGLQAAGYAPAVNTTLVQYVADPIQYLVNNLYGGLVLLLVVASAATVEFSYAMGRAVAGASRRLPAHLVRPGVIVLMAVQVFFVAYRYHGYLHIFAHYFPVAVLSAIGLAVLAGLAWLLRGLFAAPHPDAEAGGLVSLASVAYLLPVIVICVFTPAAWLFRFIVPGFTGPNAPTDPFAWLVDNVAEHAWFQVAAATIPLGLLFLAGLRGADHADTAARRRWMAGLALVAGWALWTYTVTWVANVHDFPLMTDDATLIVTAAVAVYLWRNRAHLEQGRLAFAMALITFTWLVSSDGEFLDLVGRVLRLSANVPLVFGLLLVLLGGSQFTRTGNKWLPEPARPLLWIGYLSLSLLLSFWITFSTGLPIIGDEYQLDVSYFFLLVAPPLAAWLVLTGRFSEKNPPRPAAGGSPGAAAAPAGGGEAA